MQHFTTYTWLSLAESENMREMWRITVPQLAYQHKYLMYALLACSTLHMAHIHPERRSELVIQARTYQDRAIPAFFNAVPSVDSETCDAVLIFVRVVGIVAFSLEESASTESEIEDTLPSWLFFVRSGCGSTFLHTTLEDIIDPTILQASCSAMSGIEWVLDLSDA
jgi:hypothetical protein